MTQIRLNGVCVLFTADMLKKEFVRIIMIQKQDQDMGAAHETSRDYTVMLLHRSPFTFTRNWVMLGFIIHKKMFLYFQCDYTSVYINEGTPHVIHKNRV